MKLPPSSTPPALAAQMYAAAGLTVFPLHTAIGGTCSCGTPDCPRAAKHPRTTHGVLDATVDPTVVRDWWDRWPAANIGLATGTVSSLVVVDVDGPEGLAGLKALEGAYEALPPTLKVRTARGLHLYFSSVQPVRNSQGRLAPGLDIRGDGGYVVAPPSMHATGAIYNFVDPQAPIAALPDWLLKALTAPATGATTRHPGVRASALPAEQAVRGWLRVNRENLCPICGHDSWCLIAEDGNAAICPRTPDGAVRHLDPAGYLHRLRPGRWMGRRWPRAITLRSKPAADPLLSHLAAEYEAAVQEQEIQYFAVEMDLSIASLQSLRIGWADARQAWSFPMTSIDGTVLGIRLRGIDGTKFAIAGGHEGLFIPKDLGTPDGLLVAEGPTDTAALLDLGFSVVGRPSCSGGTDLIIDTVSRLHPRLVVVVADADDAGRRGAAMLADRLVLRTCDVRIITPPAGIKDARDWVQAGAISADIECAIAAARKRKLVLVDGGRK